MKKLILKFALIISLSPFNSTAQNSELKIKELDFKHLLELTLNNNFDFLIEKFNISKAEAAIRASKIFQNPELEIILPKFNEDEFSGFPTNIAFEMEVPIELFGKRRNRINKAIAEKNLADVNFENFVHELSIEAAIIFVNALTNQLIIEQMHKTLDQLTQITEINKILFEAGEIGEIEVLQARIEARNFEMELLNKKEEKQYIMYELYNLIGGIPLDSIIFTANIDLIQPIKSFNQLKENTLKENSKISAAIKETEVALFNQKILRSERFPDISIIGGYHNEEAIKPKYRIPHSYIGIRIPIQISGFNKGEYKIGQFEYEQSNLVLKSTILEIENQLDKNYKKYTTSLKKRLLFSEEILKDTERVRDAILFSYQRGEASLLELIEAQRTSNETSINYINTLAEYNLSLVELSRISHIWLINF